MLRPTDPSSPLPPYPSSRPSPAPPSTASHRLDPRIEALTSLHHRWHPPVDWQAMAAQAPPTAPHFVPSLWDRLVAQDAVASRRHRRAVVAFERAHRRWRSRHGSASAILHRRPEAYGALLAAHDTFAGLRAVGATVTHGELRPDAIELLVHPHSRAVVPRIAPRLPAPNGHNPASIVGYRREAVVRAYRVSAALRAARDLMALLPVTYVLVQMRDDDERIAVRDEPPELRVLSVLFDRPTLSTLDIAPADLPDVLRHFRHTTHRAEGDTYEPAVALRLDEILPAAAPAVHEGEERRRVEVATEPAREAAIAEEHADAAVDERAVLDEHVAEIATVDDTLAGAAAQRAAQPDGAEPGEDGAHAARSDEPDGDVPATSPSSDAGTAPHRPWAVPYRAAELAPPETSLAFHEGAAQILIEQQVLDVVEQEGPVVTSVVLERLRVAWGLPEAEATVGGAFERAVAALATHGKLEIGTDGTLALPHAEPPVVRIPDAAPETARSAAEVPSQELVLAIENVARDEGPIPRDALLATVADLFGWPRHDATVDTTLARALERAVREDRIEVDVATGRVRMG